MPGTGGAVKLRFNSETNSQGKRGGQRIVYAVVQHRRVYFLTIYDKHQQADLTEHEKVRLKNVIKQLRNGDG